MTKEEYRIVVAVQTCNLLREVMSNNLNDYGEMVYSGSLAPNLTSVTEILTCSFDELLEAVRTYPPLLRLAGEYLE